METKQKRSTKSKNESPVWKKETDSELRDFVYRLNKHQSLLKHYLMYNKFSFFVSAMD